ncbi:MAG: transposase [Pirellulales bacterium]
MRASRRSRWPAIRASHAPACWAHARRKFVELETKHPLEAARMRALTGMLYDIEDRAKALTPDERKALRESESRPVLEKIREFLWGDAYEQSLPKNDLRKAMNYVRNNWVTVHTRHPAACGGMGA